MHINTNARESAREFGRKSYDEEGTAREVRSALGRIQGEVNDFVSRHDGRVQSIAERLQDVEQRMAADGKRCGTIEAAGGFDASALVQTEGFQRFNAGAQDRTGKLALGIATKALLNYTEATTTGTAMPVRPDRLPGFHGFALRPLRLLDFLNVRPSGIL